VCRADAEMVHAAGAAEADLAEAVEVKFVGGIARTPAVIEERVELRDMLDLTVAFDHDVVDGAPTARFVKRLSGKRRDQVATAQDIV
jgi:pyruvate/2-oxoglutarate dehydrogenase complex dihydrolipoamide acyltransferase (E2) component